MGLLIYRYTENPWTVQYRVNLSSSQAQAVHLPPASAAPRIHTCCLHRRHFGEHVLGMATETRYDSRNSTPTAAVATYYLLNFSFQCSTARSWIIRHDPLTNPQSSLEVSSLLVANSPAPNFAQSSPPCILHLAIPGKIVGCFFTLWVVYNCELIAFTRRRLHSCRSPTVGMTEVKLGYVEFTPKALTQS